MPLSIARKSPRPLFVVFALGAAVCPGLLVAQSVSFGFVGGTGITGDFQISRTFYTDSQHPSGLTAFDLFSDTHSFIAGFSTEVAIRDGFSVEVDALHRNLNLQSRFTFPDGSELRRNNATITTWEFPMLLKYRLFTAGRVHPFIEGGPSFRTRHNPAPTEPSQFGGTVGAGAEFRVGRIQISPAIRYTRWQYDGDFPRVATRRDQLEFVAGISYPTSISSLRVGSRKLHVGLIGGTPFTSGVSPRSPGERIEEKQGYIGGVVFEVEAYKRLSVEVNGLYRPYRADQLSFGGPLGDAPSEGRFEFTILTWQLPVLAKYQLRSRSRVSPFIEGGPSFRFSGNLNGSNPSGVGLTAGAGLQMKYGAIQLSPALRFTRWEKDVLASPNAGGFLTKPTQVELLASVTF